MNRIINRQQPSCLEYTLSSFSSWLFLTIFNTLFQMKDYYVNYQPVPGLCCHKLENGLILQQLVVERE